MSEQQMFQIHARCQRNPLAVEMSSDKRPEFHLVSEPMPRAAAEALMSTWIFSVTSAGWRFSIEPAASTEPARPA